MKTALRVLVCFLVLFPAAAPAAPVVSAAEQEVLDALSRSRPGDTVVVKAGSYQGGWTLKPGEPGKPITLRAERPGRVFLGALEFLSGFEPVPGAVYSFMKPATSAPPKLRELDTGKDMRWMATPLDVEEVVGSYCFDETTKRLYLHPTDSAGINHHTYAPIPTTNGITVANHTVVDDFVMTGFGGSAIYGGSGADTFKLIDGSASDADFIHNLIQDLDQLDEGDQLKFGF